LRFYCPKFSFNRTNVELKYPNYLFHLVQYFPFNRTNVELKSLAQLYTEGDPSF